MHGRGRNVRALNIRLPVWQHTNQSHRIKDIWSRNKNVNFGLQFIWYWHVIRTRTGNAFVLKPTIAETTGFLQLIKGASVVWLVARLDHRSLPLQFESRRGHIWRVVQLWLHFVTFRGRSAHLAYHVHKSGRKNQSSARNRRKNTNTRKSDFKFVHIQWTSTHLYIWLAISPKLRPVCILVPFVAPLHKL